VPAKTPGLLRHAPAQQVVARLRLGFCIREHLGRDWQQEPFPVPRWQDRPARNKPDR
jgi:hypothetical protein